MTQPKFSFAGALVLVGLSGCDLLVDGKGDRAPETVAPVAAEPVIKEVSALDKAIAAQDAYVYNPIAKRDPFRSFLATEDRQADDVPVTPLQRYEIDQYTLVGIIWGVDRPRALVQDPEGVGHVMEVGTYIGKNWGKVTRITSAEVVITEEYQNLRGDLVVNDIPMKLPITDG